MGYTVVLEQEPDGGYVVSVPALPGCVSQGDTREDALKNVSIGQQVVQNIGQGPVRPTGVDLGQIVGQRFSVLPF